MAGDEEHYRDARALLNALGGSALSYVSEYIAHLENQGELQGLAKWRPIAEAIMLLGSDQTTVPELRGDSKPTSFRVQ